MTIKLFAAAAIAASLIAAPAFAQNNTMAASKPMATNNTMSSDKMAAKPMKKATKHKKAKKATKSAAKTDAMAPMANNTMSNNMMKK